MTRKENAERSLTIRIHPTLFAKFRTKCNKNYLKMSEAVRLLILDWVELNKVGKCALNDAIKKGEEPRE